MDINPSMIGYRVNPKGAKEDDLLPLHRVNRDRSKTLVSLVVPVYNEAECLPLFIQETKSVLANSNCRWEIILVDDGSTDGSLMAMTEAAAQDNRIKILSFSRNFGHQAAITAGLDVAEGDAVAVIDADLQDPPEILLEMIERYHQGYDVVSAQREVREGETLFKLLTAKAFYWVMEKLVDPRMLPEVGDFRLFSRKALNGIRAFREQHRFMRGLVAWLGLNETVIRFRRRERAAGQTKYSLPKMVRFAWTAISSFSALPIRLSTGCGILLCIGSFLYLTYVFFVVLAGKPVVWGWASIVAFQCFFSGVMLLSLGIMGDYVAKIYEEAKQRPLYVIGKLVNIDPPVLALRRAVILADGRQASVGVRQPFREAV